MTSVSIDLNYEFWKQKVDTLIYAEYKLKYLYKNKKISEKERKKLQKIINQMWLQISDSRPHPNPELEQAFKLNFSH